MCKYNNIDNIPAKVFFDILKSKNFQLLKPKPKEKGLDKIFAAIYDDYFILSDNHQAKEYLRLQGEIVCYSYKIQLLKQSLAFYYYNPTTKEMRMQFFDALKKGYGIEVDREAEFRDEVKRILDCEVGNMENEIALAEIEMKNMGFTQSDEEVTYYDRIVEMANRFKGVLINPNMVLGEFIALEKTMAKKLEKV